MTKLKDIKLRLAKLLINCGMVKTDKGIISFDGEELLVDTIVYVEDEEGKRSNVDDGEYVDEEGRTIVVKDSKVAEIKEAEADTEVEKKDETVEVEAEDVEVVEEPKEDEKTAEDVSKAIDEIRKEVNELYKIVDSILEKLGESRDKADEEFKKVNERCNKIEKQSLAKPAEEEFAATPQNKFSKKIENFKKAFDSIR